jgi:hypothetical protein
MYLLPATGHEMVNLKVNDFTRAAGGVPTQKGLLSIIPFYLDGKDAVDEILIAIGVGELHVHEEVWLDINIYPSFEARMFQKRIAKAEKWV